MNKGQVRTEDVTTDQRTVDLADLLTELTRPEIDDRVADEQQCLLSATLTAFGRCASFDSPTVRHFDVAEFMDVVSRCSGMGVEVIAVEIFSSTGELLAVHFSHDGLPMRPLPLLERYKGRVDISVCASYVSRALTACP